jgi:myo-inositol 2-dehydrogenase/D-chiro-inositol 1-dehydrogenase
MTENSKSRARLIRRREFIGATAATAGWMIMKPSLVRGTAANSAIRIGLLGCGGRGGADATDLLNTGGARLVALADLFQDQLDKAKARFDKVNAAKGYPSVEPSQMFVGPNAFQQIANSPEVDAVVITTPPYFHVQHLDAVVTAGKHVYCEKPVAVDPWGVKQVIAIGRRAEGKLSLDVGFQIRSCPPFVELVRRIHNGALGTMACGEAHYFGTYLDRPAWPQASPVERRLRNWVYDRVLSGDIIVEQNIHAIDICNWILKAHPLRAVATGGRQARPQDGDVYGHYNVVFYYPENVAVTFSSTQFDKGWWDVTERFFGSKGVSQSPYSGPFGIWGDEPWHPAPAESPAAPESTKFSASGTFMDNLALADPTKKKEFIESITSGKFHNQAAKGAESALTCIMARTAAYENREVTWEEMEKSEERWDDGIDLNRLA